QPVTDAMEFIVATNNYRAGGGGNFPGMDGSRTVFETTDTSQEIIKDWLIEQKTVDAAVTPIWAFEPIAAPVQVVFESPPEARGGVGAAAGGGGAGRGGRGRAPPWGGGTDRLRALSADDALGTGGARRIRSARVVSPTRQSVPEPAGDTRRAAARARSGDRRR